MASVEQPQDNAHVALSYPNERQSIVDSAQHLVRSGVLSHSNHGNSSVRLPGWAVDADHGRELAAESVG